MAHGLTALLSYTVSKNMERLAYLNPQDTSLSREIGQYDTPQRMVISTVYDLPFGPHKKWFSQGRVAHHRRVDHRWNGDGAIRHSGSVVERLLSGGRSEALQRAGPEPLVQYLPQYLDRAAYRHTAHDEVAQPDGAAIFSGPQYEPPSSGTSASRKVTRCSSRSVRSTSRIADLRTPEYDSFLVALRRSAGDADQSAARRGTRVPLLVLAVKSAGVKMRTYALWLAGIAMAGVLAASPRTVTVAQTGPATSPAMTTRLYKRQQACSNGAIRL